MAKSVLFLFFVCIQLTIQVQSAVVEKPPEVSVGDKKIAPTTRPLIGEWVEKSKELEEDSEEWTEEDEKWLQEIQELLQGDDEEDDDDEDEDYEYYGADDDWFIKQIEKWLDRKYNGKYDKELLKEFLSLFREDEPEKEDAEEEEDKDVQMTIFPDLIKDDEELVIDAKTDVDSMRLKRFSSV